MILAAIFMKQRLSLLKVIIGKIICYKIGDITLKWTFIYNNINLWRIKTESQGNNPTKNNRLNKVLIIKVPSIASAAGGAAVAGKSTAPVQQVMSE